MARKIPDLEQSSFFKIQAVYNDSYLRPSQETNAGALMQIENSLKDWMPAIIRKTQENTKLKENFENAQKQELAHDSHRQNCTVGTESEMLNPRSGDSNVLLPSKIRR